VDAAYRGELAVMRRRPVLEGSVAIGIKGAHVLQTSLFAANKRAPSQDQ
jgi:hypothetical protein